MNYIPILNMEEDTLSRMKKEENFLPYIYSFFGFADNQNNISCAKKPLSGKGEEYRASKEQKELASSSVAVLWAFHDYYGDGEYEKYLSSSFNYYLGKYNASAKISVSLPGTEPYTERAAAIVLSMSRLLHSYASFKKSSYERITRDINSLISMKSYFTSKYYLPVEGKLGEEYSLLFSKEMKIRRKSTFQEPNNAAVIANNRIRKEDITTTEILESLFRYGLVEENEKGFLSLTARSELLSLINTYGVIYFRDIKKNGLQSALLSLREEGAVEESGMFFTPDETAFLEYVLGSGYKNSLSLFSYYTTEKRKDEEKAESDYMLLLSVMTALMLKTMEEISLIPQTVVKTLRNRRDK